MSKKFIFVNAQGDYEETAGAYETADFVDASVGAGDAGKPIVLDSGGKLAASILDFSVIDHDQLLNYSSDEHFTEASISHSNIDNLDADLVSIPGVPPRLDDLPEGCRFSPRCHLCKEYCKYDQPLLTNLGANHYVACHMYSRK